MSDDRKKHAQNLANDDRGRLKKADNEEPLPPLADGIDYPDDIMDDKYKMPTVGELFQEIHEKNQAKGVDASADSKTLFDSEGGPDIISMLEKMGNELSESQKEKASPDAKTHPEDSNPLLPWSSQAQANYEIVYQETLALPFVQNFLKTIPPEYATREVMERSGLMAFREYKRWQNNPVYEPHLELYDENIYLTLSKRPERLAYEQKEAWKRLKYMSTIQGENGRATMGDFYHRAIDEQPIYHEIENMIGAYHDNKPQRGLWLQGKNGIGKTYIMAAMCNTLNAQKGASVMMITASDFVQQCYDAMNQGRDAYTQLIKRAKGVDVLVLDDMGTETLNSWVIDNILTPVIFGREGHQLLTCFTSNYTIRDYREKLVNYYEKRPMKTPKEKIITANQLLSRIDSLVKEFQLSRTNYRAQKGHSAN